ncbi:hypothetical protein [Martelella alba]|uniref:hypothetical protein n=1 Tax=Martelella alba TaxID=2590451 RepID=UPI001F46EBDF|nr:hypothetical protein [Martelella alba]
MSTTRVVVQPANTFAIRHLIRRKSGRLEVETVLLNAKLAWRAHVRLPDDPTIYRVVVYHTAEIRYFRTFAALFRYYREMMPGETILPVPLPPVEEINTD